MRSYKISKTFEKWLFSQTQYEQENLSEIFVALDNIDPQETIRAHFALNHRALLLEKDPSFVASYDDFTALIEPRPMQLIALAQGLASSVVCGVLLGKGKNLGEDIGEMGRISGEVFSERPDGRAMIASLKGELANLSKTIQVLLSAVYNQGQGTFEMTGPKQACIIFDSMGCPTIQQHIWREALKAFSERVIQGEVRVTSSVIDTSAFKLLFDWSQEASEEAWSTPRVQEQRSKDQLKRTRMRSGQYRSTLAALRAPNTQGKLRNYEISDALIRWLQRDSFYPLSERAMVLDALQTVDPQDGVRGVLLSSCHGLLPQLELQTYLQMLGEIPERPMDFAPLNQGLATILLVGRLRHRSPSLFELFVEVGKLMAENFATSALGRAFLNSFEKTFSGFLKQISMMGMHLYNRGKAHLENEGEGTGTLVISDLSCPELLHYCWQGFLIGMAPWLNTQILYHQAGVINDRAFFIDLRWRELNKTKDLH